MQFRIILEKDAGSGEFIEQLHELQHKLNFVRAQQFQDAKSVEDVHDVIENLKSKVCCFGERTPVYTRKF
jgi:hypothetical protein